METRETISQKLKEVNDYFVGKIKSRDFRIIEKLSATEEIITVRIEIDGFRFCLWVSKQNGFGSFNTYGNEPNTMELTINDSQKESLFLAVWESINEHLASIVESDKIESMIQIYSQAA